MLSSTNQSELPTQNNIVANSWVSFQPGHDTYSQFLFLLSDQLPVLWINWYSFFSSEEICSTSVNLGEKLYFSEISVPWGSSTLDGLFLERVYASWGPINRLCLLFVSPMSRTSKVATYIQCCIYQSSVDYILGRDAPRDWTHRLLACLGDSRGIKWWRNTKKRTENWEGEKRESERKTERKCKKEREREKDRDKVQEREREQREREAALLLFKTMTGNVAKDSHIVQQGTVQYIGFITDTVCSQMGWKCGQEWIEGRTQ